MDVATLTYDGILEAIYLLPPLVSGTVVIGDYHLGGVRAAVYYVVHHRNNNIKSHLVLRVLLLVSN